VVLCKAINTEIKLISLPVSNLPVLKESKRNVMITFDLLGLPVNTLFVSNQEFFETALMSNFAIF
jgi:hypothetical protein